MMKKMTIAAIALTIGTGAAFAAMHGGKDHFARIDTDGNGAISKAEAETMSTERFTRMDADKSGSLTVKELGKAHGMRGHHGGKQGNKQEGRDGKGRDGVDREARIEQRFEKLDADKSGAVTLEEMKATADARTQKHDERRAARFAELDADGNGEVSKAEFVTQGVDKMFARLDTDASGEITHDEMRAGHKAMRDAHRAGKSNAAE